MRSLARCLRLAVAVTTALCVGGAAGAKGFGPGGGTAAHPPPSSALQDGGGKKLSNFWPHQLAELLPAINLRIDPSTSLKIRKRIQYFRAVLTIGIDYNTQAREAAEPAPPPNPARESARQRSHAATPAAIVHPVSPCVRAMADRSSRRSMPEAAERGLRFGGLWCVRFGGFAARGRS